MRDAFIEKKIRQKSHLKFRIGRFSVILGLFLPSLLIYKPQNVILYMAKFLFSNKKKRKKTMKVIDFNSGWTYSPVGGDKKPVDLPHDAMFSEERGKDCPSGRHGCFFKANDYEYEKVFFAQKELENNSVYFDFESVYKDAEIFINGKKAYANEYGYSEFYFCADEFLSYGEDNTIKVTVKTSDQPNSRWYSGAGIIRPVEMLVFPKKHILPKGVKITTLSYKERLMKLSAAANGDGTADYEVLKDGEKISGGSFEIKGTGETEFVVENGKLWSAETPELYTLKITFGEDEREIKFGIREVEVSAKEGLKINGERVILFGACVHHDNGLLGGAGIDFAEERKARLIKEAGYNAVRSAHNPCSKAFMRACDKLGLYILDEYVDMWYIRKTRYDYAEKVEKNYKKDLLSMVEKDYNSPSVIMYSLGNEVSETAQKRGVALLKEMTDYLHGIDYRPVTCGVNIFFNLLSSLGFGIYSDKKAEKDDGKAVGSEFFNRLAGILGDKTMKIGAKLKGCDVKTRDAFAVLDVAGYNYGILRYKKDVKKYPDRVILGTETFCNDAARFIKLAEKYPSVIGDFVWSGIDYLGEVAVGSWVYEWDADSMLPSNGWMSAGSGRIDLIGDTAGETLYTKAAFGKIKIGLAAVPADRFKKKHSPSAWKMSDAMESWSFGGAEGNKTKVEVYSDAYRAELYLNGKKVGKKKFKNDAIVNFKVKYEKGTLLAKSFDKEGNLIGQAELRSADEKTVLKLIPENESIKTKDLAYVKVRLTDVNGILKPLEKAKISIKVDGGTLLAFGHACPFNKTGYKGTETSTYLGSALAIIKPDGKGRIKIVCESDKNINAETTIEVKD